MKKSVKKALSIEYNVNMYKRKPVYCFFKRFIDILCSLLGIILLSWLFLIIAIVVKCSSKGPVIYGHKRIGRNGKEFKVYKFRTMKNDPRPIEEILTPEQLEEYKRDYKVTNDPRITKVGKILRKTSLDELPQLFNILIGNMAIIGWRPILQEELDKYGELKDLLIKVKPGLTGFWASHGRSDTTYDERIKMELFYVLKRSLLFDLRILFDTIFAVFRGDGAQ